MAKKRLFDGGSNLKGDKRCAHEVMMCNELSGGQGAYKLSWAGTKNSGLSFGGNQMDIAANSKAQEVFHDILTCAKDSNNKLILTKKEIKTAVDIAKKTRGKNPKEAYEKHKGLFDKISEALCSTQGIEKINKIYETEICERFKTVCARIKRLRDELKDSNSRKFLESLHAKLILFDYHNQFSFDVNGFMWKKIKEYDNQQQKKKKKKTLKPLDENVLKKIIKSTKYGRNNPKDVERRQNNIINVLRMKKEKERPQKKEK